MTRRDGPVDRFATSRWRERPKKLWQVKELEEPEYTQVVLYPVKLIKETKKGKVFLWAHGGHTKEHWIPKDQIFEHDEKRHLIKITERWRRKIKDERRHLPWDAR